MARRDDGAHSSSHASHQLFDFLRGARKACLFDYQERELSAFARRIGAADPFEQP